MGILNSFYIIVCVKDILGEMELKCFIWRKSFQIRYVSFRAPNPFVIMFIDANIHTLRCWTMLQNLWTLSVKTNNNNNCSQHDTAPKFLILALYNNHPLILIKTNQLCAVF